MRTNNSIQMSPSAGTVLRSLVAIITYCQSRLSTQILKMFFHPKTLKEMYSMLLFNEELQKENDGGRENSQDQFNTSANCPYSR